MRRMGSLQEAEKESKNNELQKFTRLEDKQLSWLHVSIQFISIQILMVYYWFKLSLRVYGRENCPRDWQPLLIVSNHISMDDPPLIAVSLNFRPISFMAKQELFENVWLRTYCYWVGSFAVNRHKVELSSIKSALKVLKHGNWALGLFPEGTRHQEGRTRNLKRGAAFFAQSANVPILPVAIRQFTNTKTDKKMAEVHIAPVIRAEKDEPAETLNARIFEAIDAMLARPIPANAR